MGLCLLSPPHPLLQFQSLSASSRSRFGKPVFSAQEIRDDRSLALSVRADGNRGRSKKNPYSGRSPKTEGADDNAQSFDGKSSSSRNKEEILALFKRIQSSISKGETVNPKKRTSKAADDSKPSSSAETILEVLQQSRTQRKGKSVSKKGDEFLDTLKKEEEEAAPSRPPSRFTRRSPIRSPYSPREELPPENERTPATPTLSIPGDETQTETETETDDDSNEQAMNLAQMKLPQLKEVAKSKGIKGYSKLKKSELLDLLIKSSP